MNKHRNRQINTIIERDDTSRHELNVCCDNQQQTTGIQLNVWGESDHTLRRLSKMQKLTLEVINELLEDDDYIDKVNCWQGRWVEGYFKKEKESGRVSFESVKWEVCKRLGLTYVKENKHEDIKANCWNPKTKEDSTPEEFFKWVYSKKGRRARKREQFMTSYSRSIRNLEVKGLITIKKDDFIDSKTIGIKNAEGIKKHD